MVTTETETKPKAYTRCERCKAEFEYQPITVWNREYFKPKNCADCSPVVMAEQVISESEKEAAQIESDWMNLCPPLYRDSDAAKLPLAASIIPEVLAWTRQPQGIGLAGNSGAGKTRLMFMLLRKLHFSGVRCKAITAKRFEKWCHRMFDKDDDARINIQAAHTIPVLFIDDIGKEKYTERVESEFYDLVEHRTSHLLPILWTANATGEQLAQMMGNDRGVPIVRRLREFSTVISV